MKDIIDVKFEELTETYNDEKNNVVVPTSPEVALITEAINVLNNVTNAVKEYNIAKQQEITQRKIAMRQIDAQLQTALSEINAKKELWLKIIDTQHEADMHYLENQGRDFSRVLDVYIKSLEKAIDCATQTNDFTNVTMLINSLNAALELRSKMYLDLADRRSNEAQMLLENSVSHKLLPSK